MISLKGLIKYYQLYWYFFENADERWLNLLVRERLFFQTAQEIFLHYYRPYNEAYFVPSSYTINTKGYKRRIKVISCGC